MFWRPIMIKKYKIKGLDCPNCAIKLEERLNKIEGVRSLKINFLRSELQIDCLSDDVERKVFKLASRHYITIVI